MKKCNLRCMVMCLVRKCAGVDHSGDGAAWQAVYTRCRSWCLCTGKEGMATHEEREGASWDAFELLERRVAMHEEQLLAVVLLGRKFREGLLGVHGWLRARALKVANHVGVRLVELEVELKCKPGAKKLELVSFTWRPGVSA